MKISPIRVGEVSSIEAEGTPEELAAYSKLMGFWQSGEPVSAAKLPEDVSPALPIPALQFALMTWGKPWVCSEMESLSEFAAMVRQAKVVEGR